MVNVVNAMEALAERATGNNGVPALPVIPVKNRIIHDEVQQRAGKASSFKGGHSEIEPKGSILKLTTQLAPVRYVSGAQVRMYPLI